MCLLNFDYIYLIQLFRLISWKELQIICKTQTVICAFDLVAPSSCVSLLFPKIRKICDLKDDAIVKTKWNRSFCTICFLLETSYKVCDFSFVLHWESISYYVGLSGASLIKQWKWGTFSLSYCFVPIPHQFLLATLFLVLFALVMTQLIMRFYYR